MNDVAAVILAAGRSRRMGAFKPLLPFGHATVIESCVTNLFEAGVSDIVVVVGYRGDEIRKHLEEYEVTFASNPDHESEMSVSIARGIDKLHLNSRAVLITPVDYPAVPPQVIKLLVQEWSSSGSKLIQPEHGGRGGHPVLIDLSFRSELMNLDPTEGLRSLFDRHRAEVRRLPVESPFVARDMDTWDDYCALYQAVFDRKPPETEAI